MNSIVFVLIAASLTSKPDSGATAPKEVVAPPVVQTDTLVEEDFIYNKNISDKEAQQIQKDGNAMVPWQIPDFEADNTAKDMVKFARKFYGTRYVRGGKKPGGFDCSGFTSYVFRNFGIILGATPASQAAQSVKVSNKDVKPGDLVFFTRSPGRNVIGHVGMVTEVNPTTGAIKFIHATTKKGIMENTYPNDSYYRSRFLGARRVLNKP